MSVKAVLSRFVTGVDAFVDKYLPGIRPDSLETSSLPDFPQPQSVSEKFETQLRTTLHNFERLHTAVVKDIGPRKFVQIAVSSLPSVLDPLLKVVERAHLDANRAMSKFDSIELSLARDAAQYLQPEIAMSKKGEDARLALLEFFSRISPPLINEFVDSRGELTYAYFKVAPALEDLHLIIDTLSPRNSAHSKAPTQRLATYDDQTRMEGLLRLAIRSLNDFVEYSVAEMRIAQFINEHEEIRQQILRLNRWCEAARRIREGHTLH